MSRLQAEVAGVAVWGPGLAGWEAGRAVLAGQAPYTATETPPPVPALLPPNERRRTGPVVRLALAVAQQAVAAAGMDAAALRSVFASANGDGPVVGSILEALTAAASEAQRVVSPTQFHNSVHNAAAGYWSIGAGNPLPATCLGCHDSTWAAGLLAALIELRRGEAVLLCAYDHPMPERYAVQRPILAPFGVGLVLQPVGHRGRTLGRLEAEYVPAAAAPMPPAAPALRALAAGNPAAQSLRLLERLAGSASGRCDAGYLEGRLEITFTAAAA